MDYVTQILDAAKQDNGWTIYTDGDIRNQACRCPIIAAAVTLNAPHATTTDNSDYDNYLFLFNISDEQALFLVCSADYDEVPIYKPYQFNPFLRDRLCLELVGGYE